MTTRDVGSGSRVGTVAQAAAIHGVAWVPGLRCHPARSWATALTLDVAT
ncbi:hypothetical protein [Nocardia sp. CY41]|nr:hypothetical protein [Nocardia sp. CY41]